ncbi:MAG: Rab family GTPase [Candidatus Kariarchaeaceae archaeon]
MSGLKSAGKNPVCKVVLIGAEGVGKTSLKRNYMGQGFRSSHLLTLGTEFSHKLIKIDENISLNAQIWDLASQSAFESIRKQKYLKKTSGALLVFDLSRYETFLQLSHWLKELIDANPKSKLPILIIGNKNDLAKERAIPSEEIEKYVIHLQKDKTIPSKWIEYIETSAKTGENVEEGFLLLGKQIANFVLFKKFK